MAKFTGYFHESQTVYFEVEAETEEQARELVESGEYEETDIKPHITDVDILNIEEK